MKKKCINSISSGAIAHTLRIPLANAPNSVN